MKIGILTFQGASNYGAVLQALGLCKYLERCGHEVDVIDYYAPELYGLYDYHIFSKPVSFRSVVSKTLRRRRNEREFKAFELFRRQYLTFSPHCETSNELKEVCECYDAVICGSDQVWNPKANGNHNEEYFLSPVDGSKVKKIAYAASFGNIECAKGLERNIAHWLKDFRGVSVREDEAVHYVSSLCSNPVKRVLDPSMLLDASDYMSFEKSIETPKHFLLTYMLGANEGMRKAVEIASSSMDLPVIALGRKMSGGEFIKDIGPGEFLSLFRKADAVITNSFHGSAFSMLYGKPFVSFGNGRYNSRMETLLGAVGQPERFISNTIDKANLLDFLSVALEKPFSKVAVGERDRSAKFLAEALDESDE